MSLLAYAWVLPLLPLAVFVVVLATGRRLPEDGRSGLGHRGDGRGVRGVARRRCSRPIGGAEPYSASVPWLQVGRRAVELGVHVDPLTALMLVIVSLVSLLVQIYSIGYMHDDERFRWYFGAISLFTAAMLGVVLAERLAAHVHVLGGHGARRPTCSSASGTRSRSPRRPRSRRSSSRASATWASGSRSS